MDAARPGRALRELPAAIAAQVNAMPECSYGVSRVILKLQDGTVIRDVYVGWGLDVLRVGDSRDVEFDPATVVAVEHQP
jgi:hypothetical protein